MKKRGLYIITIIAIIVLVVFAVIDSKLNEEKEDIQIKAYQQHIEAMKNGADPSLGITEIPDDFIVGDDFVSHLPLVVIDINNQDIPITRTVENNADGTEKVFSESGKYPYVLGTISIIDNSNCNNKISDEATTESNMKIKLRGSSSQGFEKKQYAIKMLDENGENRKVDVMNMGENNDWILNISMLDGSLMRNYTAYMFGSALFPQYVDCRYCEVFNRLDDGEYEYMGLYLMMEKIEKGSERVDISTYKKGDKVLGYILCRDRENLDAIQISTYGNQNNLTYGRISVLYPEKEDIDDYVFNYIQDDIDKIERVLYSDKLGVFRTWQEYIDKESFVDYYVFNSIFRNYDAGNNSTYMYKDKGGKLCMGPVWDYDNACDNDYNAIQVPDYNYFNNHPWFDRLVLSKTYVKALEHRYSELTDGIFSADYIEQYTNDVETYLGNAALREWSRWGSHYGENSSYSKSYGLVDSQGFAVDRITQTHREEVVRYQNYFRLEESFMDANLKALEEDVYDDDRYIGSYMALLFVVGLVSAITIISRRRMYK